MNPSLNRFEFTRPQMGAPFRIVLYAPDNSIAEKAAEAAFQKVSGLNEILSDYEFDSELSRLSRGSGQGKKNPVSRDLWLVLRRGQRLAQITEGAFDVTVGPYANLWRKARRVKQLPEEKYLADARERVGYPKLRLDEEKQTAELLAENMRLDLGGIAKGYAVDAALKVLKQHGIARALVGAGGDIAAGDSPPGKPGWRVALAQLDLPEAPAGGHILLTNGAVSTSGDLAQRLEIDGKRYSHILDPRTGLGLIDHSLVTVLAPDSMTADSLATALSVLGPEKGLPLLKEFPGTEARMVHRPGGEIRVYSSPGFDDLLSPARGAER